MTAGVTAPIVLAVDGGNSKTDLALVAADGRVLSLVRGPLSSPHHLGVDGSVEVLERLFRQAVQEAGVANANGGPVAAFARLCMAGVDFPAEEEVLQERIARLGWAEVTSVVNDTFAVLRAGTESGWGIAIVCGAGINCVGVGPDGRQVRFASLGELSGDWGGGYDVGMAAVSAAARSEDGRGPETSLERAVPAHFGLGTPQELTEAIHTGTIERRRVLELPPIVFAEADYCRRGPSSPFSASRSRRKRVSSAASVSPDGRFSCSSRSSSSVRRSSSATYAAVSSSVDTASVTCSA